MINYFLQSSSEILPMIAIVISVLTAAFLFFSLKQSKDVLYVEILRKTMGDLYNLYQTEKTLETKNDCELYAVRLLDLLAVLAHLYNKGKISDEILEFIKYEFSYAKRVMLWFDEKKLNEKYEDNSEKIWSNITQYFQKNPNVKMGKVGLLPESLKKYDELKC